MREIRHQAEAATERHRAAADAGWDLSRIEVLCCLNSFYQVVLGPLATVARATVRSGLVSRHAIHYGLSMNVNDASIGAINACMARFEEILKRFNINPWWLHAARGNDLLYRLGRPGVDHE
jgi:hypothetical protein